MDMRTGEIFPDYETAKKVGVPDDELIMGTKEALEKLRKKLVFTKGSFKQTELVEK